MARLEASYERHAFVKREDTTEKLATKFRIGESLENDSCLGAAGFALRRSSRSKASVA
jgi:hypothetical protein